MEYHLFLGAEEITYTLKRSARARRLRLTLQAEGELLVTIPTRVSLEQVERLIREHADWILKQRARHLARPRQVLPAISDMAAYRLYKQEALTRVKDYLALLEVKERLPRYTVTIKNHRTRWGSCSRVGSLNFNYRIALLPAELAEYIVVHEVCHLFEMNHSLRFWKRVEAFLPDYKECRLQLRGYTWKKE